MDKSKLHPLHQKSYDQLKGMLPEKDFQRWYDMMYALNAHSTNPDDWALVTFA